MASHPHHPGKFIREHVIPTGMSVKEAAKRLGVGRPALSNLLNGNSSLSPDMAIRLGKAFGADQQQLLDLQAAFERYDRRGEEKAVAVGTYVPSFLSIKARQIHAWAESNLDARHLLSVLLRKLVHSTGHELRQVDFPGYDNAERRGWDGFIEADAATPWIPEGKSGWEFGTNQSPGSKAEGDYAARLASVPLAERVECTFVFVTPRNWPGKTEWARSKNAAGDWKAVRTLDASDLEQWLEESIPAPMWFAERLGLPISGFETLDQCWQRWAAASDPPIAPAMFEPSITSHREKFKDWLSKQSERPFVVAADSKDEALAFLACLFQDIAVDPKAKDLAAVFDAVQTLRTLAASSSRFIPIVFTEEAERELATIYRRLHCIIVRPRNAIDSQPDVVLDLLGHDAFAKALAIMGIEGERAERLARESGNSPTILRRRLSKIDAIRTPHWARDAQVAKTLIPMALVGAWHAKSSADREVLSTLANVPYQEIEENVTHLLQLYDCPVWSSGQYRGIASKVDSLFAVNKRVTERDLDDFFVLAGYVLSETDPALTLPEDQRWVAGLYGKVRDHSAVLRDGICETLVILSVHGNNLFHERLGVDVEACVSMLVRRLLTPLTLDTLRSHDNELPRYAEAAPDEFLKLFEADLRQPQPVALGLLKPASSGVFSGCPRTGLLWALECLAWQNLPRVSAVLAQLSRTVIDDNWANKPSTSLAAIYRSWMPQTAASLEERMRALETLTKRFPDIGWQICIQQISFDSRLGHYSYRPRWRSDASGTAQPVTGEERREFTRKALDLVLAWQKHDQKTLGDLVKHLQGMIEKDQTAVWELIDAWADAQTDDKAKADLRERIRRFAFTRRGRQRGLNDVTKDRARAAYAKLQAHDPVIRHTWLFASQWVEESSDEIEDEDLDFSKREERIHKLRAAAMKEIWAERGFDGVMMLLSDGKVSAVVGHYLAININSTKVLPDFLRRSLFLTDGLEEGIDSCIRGLLASVDEEERGTLLGATAKGMDTDQIVRLFRCAPFGQNTWRLLDQYDQDVANKYWQDVSPHWTFHSEGELTKLIDRLLEAKRPRAAFRAAHLDWTHVETSRLKRLLLAIATVDAEPRDHYMFDANDISRALDSLDGRTGISPDQMAQLEFMFIEALRHSEHGIPNLERQIAQSPAIFVQAVALVYKRRNDGQDPSEWSIDDPGHRAVVASAAHSLLEQLKRIPGNMPNGKVDTEALCAWVVEVRRLCAEYGRADMGDQKIGLLLSKAPAEEDGSWPCLPVCEALERVASPQIARGFEVAVHNGRGMHSRGEGGAQERELAAKYQGWMKQRAFDYPYVGSILESIAADYDRQAERHDSEAKIRKRLHRY